MSEEVKEKALKAKDKDKASAVDEARRKSLSIALANIEKVHGKPYHRRGCHPHGIDWP